MLAGVVITFRARHSWGKMYIGHGHCVSDPRCIPTLLHGPGCNLGEWSGVPSSCALGIVQICNWCTGFVAITYTSKC